LDYKKIEDTGLIRLIAQGNADALGELYDRYSRLVFSIAYNSLGNYATAEEITQDVFTRVWEKSHTYDANLSKVSTWMITIARNRAIDQLRREKIRLDQSSLGWEELSSEKHEMGADLQETVELSLERSIVRKAILELPADQQKALALAYFRGYSHTEIAEILGEPLGTVKTRIRLAMQKLRQLLTEQDHESE